MRPILNVIWVVFSGFWLFLSYAVAGVLLCLMIITIPAGVACFRLANYALWPFGRTVVDNPGAGAGSLLGNVLWLVTFGWLLALSHLITAFVLAITIIGLPLAAANLKMVPLALLPFGKVIVPTDRPQPYYYPNAYVNNGYRPY